jgi:hypothetical protein
LLLEQRSVAARLRVALSGLIRQRKVLAALAAVKGIRQPGSRRRRSREPDGGSGDGGGEDDGGGGSGGGGGGGTSTSTGIS